MTLRRFLVLVGGLPPECKFAKAWRETPRVISDPDEIARITGQGVRSN